MDGQNFNQENENSYNSEQNYYHDYTSMIPEEHHTETNAYNAPSENKKNIFAIIGLITGICSILFSCCCGLGFIFAIAGVICSVCAIKKEQSGLAIAGVICSIIGLLMSLGFIISLVFSGMKY